MKRTFYNIITIYIFLKRQEVQITFNNIKYKNYNEMAGRGESGALILNVFLSFTLSLTCFSYKLRAHVFDLINGYRNAPAAYHYSLIPEMKTM